MIPYWFPSNDIEELKSYDKFHKIAEGSYGDVYEAMQKLDSAERLVIIKRFKPAYEEPHYRERFLHEMKLLKSLNHPQIPHYLDGYAGENEVFYIMEKAEGHSLAKLAHHAKAMKRPFHWGTVFQATHQCLQIIHYLHHWKDSQGNFNPIVHSDLKPSNLMIDPAGKVSLIDFSMGIFAKDQNKFFGGTRKYLPLEFFIGEPPSPQADIFSVATLFFFLLTGIHPIGEPLTDAGIFGQLMKGKNLQVIRDQKLSPDLERLILKGMATEAKDRFESAETFDQELIQVAAEESPDWEDWDRIKREIGELSTI